MLIERKITWTFAAITYFSPPNILEHTDSNQVSRANELIPRKE